MNFKTVFVNTGTRLMNINSYYKKYDPFIALNETDQIHVNVHQKIRFSSKTLHLLYKV